MKEERAAWRLKLLNEVRLTCLPGECGPLEGPRKGLLWSERSSQTVLIAECRVDWGRGGAAACHSQEDCGEPVALVQVRGNEDKGGAVVVGVCGVDWRERRRYGQALVET